MFYLKTVVLECVDKAPLPPWEGHFREAGIALTWRSREACREEAAQAREELCEGADGVLWVTGDEEHAKELVRLGKPVLGLLRGEDDDRAFRGVPYLGMKLMELEPEYLEKVYRRQAGISWDILETGRCLVRETRAEDAGELYALYAEPSITAHLEKLPKDPNAFKAWLEDYAKHVYAYLGYGIWTVCLKEDGRIIGRAGLTVREGFEAPELGFVIGKPWQGQGLAHEVCSAILDYAGELGIGRSIAFAAPGNDAARGLLRKLGFHEEGRSTLPEGPCLRYARELRLF